MLKLATGYASEPTRRFASGLIEVVISLGDQHDYRRRTSWNDSRHCSYCLLPAQNLNLISRDTGLDLNNFNPKC